MLVVQKVSLVAFASVQPTLVCHFGAEPPSSKTFVLKNSVLLGRSATFINLSVCGHKMFCYKLSSIDD